MRSILKVRLTKNLSILLSSALLLSTNLPPNFAQHYEVHSSHTSISLSEKTKNTCKKFYKNHPRMCNLAGIIGIILAGGGIYKGGTYYYNKYKNITIDT